MTKTKFIKRPKPDGSTESDVWINPSVVIFIYEPISFTGNADRALVPEQFRSTIAPCKELAALTCSELEKIRGMGTPGFNPVGRLYVNPAFVVEIGPEVDGLTTVQIATWDGVKSFKVQGGFSVVAEQLGIDPS